MRYFLENKLDSPCGKSLFTGLRTVTHFGRPDFNELLEDVQQKNSAIGKIGVFSCGPPALSKAVDKAAKHLNKYDNALFEHFFENF
jgi:dual oxidase